MRISAFPEKTARLIAACEAVGLHFWANHPTNSHVWAVGDDQRAHIVRFNLREGTAQHVCTRYSSSTTYRFAALVHHCQGEDRIMSFPDPIAMLAHTDLDLVALTGRLTLPLGQRTLHDEMELSA